MRELERLALLEALDVLERAAGNVSHLHGAKGEERNKAADKLTARHARAIQLIQTALDYGDFAHSAMIETASARKDKAKDNQPRRTMLSFWRRLTSISVRNQSPVSRLNCDQCAANSSSDMARSCAAVKDGGDDIEQYLSAVMKRYARTGHAGKKVNRADLTAYGHLVAVDIPTLMMLVRRFRDSYWLLARRGQ